MKISSVSKKVLCGALSAAMVVAFAPTVAFGAEKGDKITFSYDVNGGTIVDTHIASIPSEEVTVASDGTVTLDGYGKIAADANNLKKGASAFAYWYVDVDNSGEYESAKDAVVAAGTGVIAAADVAKLNGGSFTLKAAYSEPTLTPVFNVYTLGGAAVPTSASLTAAGLNNTTQYSAKMAFPDGTTVVNADVAIDGSTAGTAGFTFTFTDAQKAAIAEGDYTFSVSDATNGVVATKKATICKVSLSAGAGYRTFTSTQQTSFLIYKGGAIYASSIDGPTAAAGTTSYNVTGWELDGATYSGSNVITFNKSCTLTATYDNPQAGPASININGGTYSKGQLSFTPVLYNSEIDTTTDQWDATVTGPNGFSKVIKNVTNGSVTTLDFGANWEGDTAVTAKLAAGTYTISIAPAAKANETLSAKAADATPVTSSSVTLAAVTYDLGAGSWTTTDAKGNIIQPTTLPTLLNVNTALNSISLGAVTAANIKADDPLQAFDYYTINGKKVSDLKSTDLVDASGVTVAVVYKTAYIAAPTVAFTANGTTKFNMTVTPAAGTKAFYSLASAPTSFAAVPDNGVITLEPAKASDASVWVKVTTADGKTSSQPVQYDSTATAAGTVEAYAKLIANAETTTSAKNAPVRYGDTLKTLAADAKAAIAGIGYATQAEINAAVSAQYVSLIEQAATVETANLDAKKGLVKAADGKSYTFLSDAAYDVAAANIAKVAAAVKANNNYKANGTTPDATDDVVTVNGVGVAANTATVYVSALKAAVTGAATTKVAVADAEAVVAVDAALEAAKTVAEAEAALAQFEALTAAQQDMVSATAVAAAQKIVLVDTQDASAAKDVKAVNKTYTSKNGKLAATKTFKMKAITSKSGAKATYKKANSAGKTKITVAKSGKVTVKKGLKKGTYKVKVKGTVGAHAKTVTCKIVVK